MSRVLMSPVPTLAGPPRPRGGRRVLLDDGGHNHQHVYLLGQLQDVPREAGQRSVEMIARLVEASHPFYGEVKLDHETFGSFIRNFEADTWGQEVYLDLNHNPYHGVLAKFVRLFVQGDYLMAEIEWTEFGVSEYERTGFRYFSVDFTEQYMDPETGDKHGALLFGAGLVPRPFIKRMPKAQGPHSSAQATELQRFSLSEGREGVVPPWLHFHVESDMKKFLDKLKKSLQAKNLAESVINQILKAAEAGVKALGDSATDAQMAALSPVYETIGDSVAKQFGDAEIKITLPELQLQAPSGGQQLSEEELSQRVAAEVKRLNDEQQQSARQLAEATDARRKQFRDAIEAAEGLSDEIKKQLSEGAEDITGDLSEAHVAKLAERTINMGNQLAVAEQRARAGMQFGGQGSPHVLMGADNTAHKLTADIQASLRGTSSHTKGDLRLEDPEAFEKRMPGVAKVLQLFDSTHASRLHQEAKQFADGKTDMASTDLPVGFQRMVIQEALSDLNILNACTVDTDPNATETTQIPYETRDKSAIQNNGIVYEGQGIHLAGVQQQMDSAYIVPMKLAMQITNEVMHFTRTSGINFDAYARNVSGNARTMRELMDRRIANELQRAADSYGAVAVSGESIAAQLNGSNSTIKLAQFPLVRPHQVRNLQGNAIGNELNPIVIDFDGTPCEEWDGTGDQAAGTYYRVVNYNLSYIQFVDEAGDPVTPSEATATASYSRATNVVLFDLDEGSTDVDVHLNGLLRKIGSQKAILSADRFVVPNMALCSPILHDTISNAKQFEANSKRPDANLTAAGVTDVIKQMNTWNTNAPGIDLGDERLIIGQAGLLNYKVAKPFITGAPYEIFDSAGKPVGKKGAYGEEYSAIKVPGPTNERLTSVIAYSATARNAVA